MAFSPRLLLPSIALLLAQATTYATSSSGIALPGCMSKCASIDIPYPFGINDVNCFMPHHQLKCNTTTNKLFLGGFEVLSIDILQGELHATMPAGEYCYKEDGQPRSDAPVSSGNLMGSPYTFSSRNVFTVIGCDTMVQFSDPSKNFVTGCMSLCNYRSPIKNNTCNGIGCCQISIPEGLKQYEAKFQSFNNYTDIWNLSNCGYAFLVEEGTFKFNTTILNREYDYGDLRLPLVMDWVVGKESCVVAKMNETGYACRSSHSFCLDSDLGGYRCNCSKGYVGNPYLEGGCQDINEYEEPNRYPCFGICMNTPGDYNCTCNPGTHGKNPKSEQCIPDPVSNRNKMPFIVKLLLGVGAGILFLMVVTSWIYWGWQKRKMMLFRQIFFQQNGGLFLLEEITSRRASSFKIFSINEMERATNNFDEKRVLGKGGNGIVYKGILSDGTEIAVKRSMMMNQKKHKEFAREMAILSQINHINIVKLLGCCLEVEVPMLVYEYIPNGTLFHFIHRTNDLLVSLETRLRIVAEIAEALAYLHSAASPPILHGDVKSSNVLLDNNYMAKVSDFGTSVLVPNDKTQFTTIIQGTCGYLDPEYLQTCHLTEKSDVYSFGVVLVELLTRRKAFNFGSSGEEKSLAQSFISFANQNRLEEILDPQITSDGLTKKLEDASRIAVQCLSLSGSERPTMREVVMEIQALRSSDRHPWVQHHAEERQRLLDVQVDGGLYRTMGGETSLELSDYSVMTSGR